MPQVTMADATQYTLADAAEYNKVTANIRDLDSRLAAVEAAAPVVARQSVSGTSFSTSYTATLTSGVTCSFTFVAPPSGAVLVSNSCDSFTNTTAFIYCAFEIRAGSTIGSGTPFLAADDSFAIKHQTNTQTFGMGRTRLVTGLTPGATYNIQQVFRVSAGTGSWSNKELSVIPSL